MNINFAFEQNNKMAMRIIKVQTYMSFVFINGFWVFMAIFGIPFLAQELLNVSIESALVIGSLTMVLIHMRNE